MGSVSVTTFIKYAQSQKIGIPNSLCLCEQEGLHYNQNRPRLHIPKENLRVNNSYII